MKVIGLLLLLVGVGGVLSAGYIGAVPEVDGSTAGSAIPLLVGAFLVMKARLKK